MKSKFYACVNVMVAYANAYHHNFLSLIFFKNKKKTNKLAFLTIRKCFAHIYVWVCVCNNFVVHFKYNANQSLSYIKIYIDESFGYW